MRFLIVAAIFACAAAAPSGTLLATSYSSGLLSHGAHLAYAAPVAVAHAALAVPTIPAGDIQGAAIDAHVQASDHARASVDAVQQLNDQAREQQGRAINAAEDHAWQAVNSAQVAAAQVDGASASIAPVAARQLAGHAVVAPALAAYSAPVVAAPALSAYTSAYGVPAISAYSAPVVAGHAASRSVAYQSLSQTHPAPLVHAPVAYATHAW
ncbi:unnamed protein product, partial [Brenthis ino]